ncbi:MAG TPA: ATP-binding protein [Tepidisphaeraceae bacterium]
MSEVSLDSALLNDVPGLPAMLPLARSADDLEQVYRQLIQKLPAAVYVCDAQGRVKFFNPAAAELWGREPKIGVDLWCGSWKIYNPDGSALPLDACPMAIALNEGTSVRGVAIVIERPDGSRRNVLPFPSPIRDIGGNIIGAVNMLVDITDRMQSDSIVDGQRRALELAVHGAPLADVLKILAQTVENLLGENARASILLLDGNNLRHGAAPSLPDDYNKYIDGVKIGPDIGSCGSAAFSGKTVIVADIANDPRWAGFRDAALGIGLRAAWSKPILSSQGKVLGTFGLYYRHVHTPTQADMQVIELLTHTAAVVIERDQETRQRLAAEQSLREAKESAEAANRSKDKFLAVLSHELRTPLTPVLMSVAAMEVDPELPPLLRQEMSMIRRNVELETKLIDDLLDLSRITSGKMRLSLQAVDLNEAVRYVCDICRGQILEKGIRLHCDFDSAVGSVTADPARLQQILWNVLKNAAKFTPEGGEIRVRTQKCDRDRASVCVSDNGAGIDAELLPRIFDAFEQGQATVTRQFGGLGLGLAISKAMVELHDGTIRAESDGANRGSRFTIELPARIATGAHPADGQSGTDARPVALRLLVVEDHADTARMLGRLLQAAGYVVKTTHNAAGALALAEREKFDLIVSDIGLPDATGYELMQQLRDRYQMRGIAMSGYGMDEDLRRSREAGFSDHLIKPVNVAQLDRAIRQLADTRS